MTLKYYKFASATAFDNLGKLGKLVITIMKIIPP